MGGTGFVAGFTMAPVDLLQTSASTLAPTALATHIAMDPGPTMQQSEAVASSNAAAETFPTESTASASDATKTGLGAGLGVGVPLLAGLILALFFLTRLRRQNNSQRTDSEKKTTGAEPDGDITARHVRHEMESLPSEMPNSRLEMTQELGV